MTDLSPILAKADEALPQSLERLFDLVRIPSISTDPAYKADCRKAGEWLVSALTELGFDICRAPAGALQISSGKTIPSRRRSRRRTAAR